MEILSAEKRLTALVHTGGFRKLRDFLNLLLDNPVWWYCSGPEETVHILESHGKTGCGLLHNDPAIRDQWMEATFAAVWQAGREKVALMAACPPESTQIVTPILCGEDVTGFIGLAHLPNFEQRRLYPFLPLLAQHIQQIAERERATEDLNAIKRLWKEVVSTLDSEVLLTRILEEIAGMLGARDGVVLLVDHEHRLARSASIGFAAGGKAAEDFHISSTPYENKVLAWPQAAQLLSEGDPLSQWYRSLYETPTDGLAVWGIPLALSGKLLGLVLCTGKEGAVLLPHLDVALETLALGSSVAIRNALDFEQMRQKAVALGTVHSVYRLVSTTRLVGDMLSRAGILSRIGKLILQVLNVRKCSIMLVDEKKVLQPCVRLGLEEGEVGTVPLKVGEGIPGRAAEDSTSLMIDSPAHDPRFASDPKTFYPSPSYLSVPMFEADVIGVMTVADKIGNQPRLTEGDREVLHTMAEQAVIALLNIEFFEKQEKIALKTMGAFDNLFETGDPDQQGQAHKLATFMDEFAAFLKIDALTRQIFQMAAFIEGIAMLHALSAVDAPQPPANGEFREIETAIRLAKRLELPENVISILRDLHENFDGTGGPRQLKGEEIPMGARLLSLCTEYLRLIAPPQAGEGLSVQQAIESLRNEAGKSFDPNLVQSLGEFAWEGN
jgi:GAF domain-containing protein